MIEILTAILVIITLAYAYFTYGMLQASRDTVKAMQRQIQETTRPYVGFDLVPYGPLIEISMKNSGATPAIDIMATVSPPVFGCMRASRLSGTPIAFLAPNRELRELLGNWAEVKSMSDSMRFSVSLSYFDSSRQKYTESYTIDLGGLGEMSYVGRPDIAQELKKIAESISALEKKAH